MTWKYILFDLDGTITDSGEGILNCVRYALEAAGRPVPPEEDMWQFIGPPLIDSFQEISGMDYDEALRSVEKYRERYSSTGIFENKLYQGIDTVLGSVKEGGYLMAIATSKPEEYTERILEHFAIAGYFDEVVGSTKDGRRNRKADVIREVFNRMDITEESKPGVIMVGDRKYDILGAKECGIASLGVAWGFGPEHELEEYQADYIVRQVRDLPAFFGL